VSAQAGAAAPAAAAQRTPNRVGAEARMIDLVYVAVPVAFFAVAWAYARACDRI
jgi:hypothetical protein